MKPVLELRATPPEGRAPGAWVVASGKGGVGKSLLSTLLAVESARRGRATLLFDGAQNQGNLHVLLDRRPARGLSAVWHGEAEPAELLIPLRDRLWLLPAPPGEHLPHSLGPLERARLHYWLSALYQRFDRVIVDGGPGLEGALRAATIGASGMAVVAVPEPAALSDAYALVKLAHLGAPHLPVGLVVNRVESEGEAEAVHERLELATRKFLRRELPLLGAVPEEGALRLAARTPGRLLERAPESVEHAVRTIVDRFESLAPAEAAA